MLERNEIFKILEDLFGLKNGELKEDFLLKNLDTLENWDSLSKLFLMSTVKNKFNTILTINEIHKFNKVVDIYSYLENI